MISPLGNSQISHGSQFATRGTIRVSETFVSRQGEGKWTGTESFFIRTSGCNLRCWFCDTPYASWNASGENVELEWLVRAAGQSGCSHVVLTGGEPLLFAASTELCQRLRAVGMTVTIETAGTVRRSVACDLLSLSPKFSSSAPDAASHPQWHQRHQRRRLPLETMRWLIEQSADFQLKFVVGSPQDYVELETIVGNLAVNPDDVWVMPQATTEAALDEAVGWLEPWCRSQGYRYCERMQIRWYGNRRGT